MSNCACPLCQSPMIAAFQPSEHPAIPDRTVLTCSACFLTLQDEDYATFDASQYAAPMLTCAARTLQVSA